MPSSHNAQAPIWLWMGLALFLGFLFVFPFISEFSSAKTHRYYLANGTTIETRRDSIEHHMVSNLARGHAELPYRYPIEGLEFRVGTAIVKPEHAAASIDALAKVLVAFPEYPIEVEAWISKTGSPMAGFQLALARASVVRQALVDRGIWPERITISASQTEQPTPVRLLVHPTD